SSWLVASTLDLGEVLERLADVAQTRLGVDVVRIWLLDVRAGVLTLRAETGTTGERVESLQTLSVGEGLAGRVFETQEPLVVTDVMQDTRVRNRTWFAAQGIRSAMTVPILVDGAPIGIIACMTRAHRDFSPDEVKLAAAVASPAATALRTVLRETRHLLHADGAYCSFVEAGGRDVETVVMLGALNAELPRLPIA